MRGRPHLFTSYQSEMRLLPTTTKRVAMALLLVIMVLLPLHALPFLGFLGDSDWLLLIDRMLVFAIAALGLNLAREGEQTLVMTFDPSLRLKDTLGVGDEAREKEVEVQAGTEGRSEII